jgi:predicted NBD/HSP70 family sugar kinase
MAAAMRRLSPVQPALLAKMNERQVLQTLLEQGPLSRAALGRVMGITAPTVAKAVEALLGSSLVEEAEGDRGVGRPARKVRLAEKAARVVGWVIDTGTCRVVSAGLDGRIDPDRTRTFATPATYGELISAAAREVSLLAPPGETATLGVGISVPGLVDRPKGRSLLSPNVPITNGRAPGLDLEERLGIPCVIVQEEHGLCLAERYFGSARGLDDFAMLDVSTGVGLGVMSGGRLLTGKSGLAGEIGHVTVELNGRRCGCGNTGCLETLACDTAFAATISRRVGQPLTIDEVLTLRGSSELLVREELEVMREYLSVAIAAVVNLFNPAALFVHGRLFELDDGLFDRVVARAKERALAPSFGECRIVRARGSKRQGAVAGIIDHLFESIVRAEYAR